MSKDMEETIGAVKSRVNSLETSPSKTVAKGAGVASETPSTKTGGKTKKG